MRANRFRGAVCLPFVLILVLLACSKPTKIIFKPDKFVLYDVGATRSLSVTVMDQKDNTMSKVKVTFLSSAPEVADVGPDGKVTAKSSGEAIITATTGKLTATSTCTVKVVRSLQLGLPDSGTLGLAGTTAPLNVKAFNEKNEAVDLTGVTFTSSAPAVAAVNEKGILTLNSTGVTLVTASCGKTTATLNVNVEIETPAAIKVDNPNQSLAVGETKPLEFTVLSTKGRPIQVPVSLTTSTDKVATVDEKGNVTGVSRGSAVIMVTTGNAKNTIKLTVR